jgi:hypothetical protein
MKIPSSLGRVAIAAGAVLVLGGSAVGIAAAQSQPASAPTPYQKFIDALAQKLRVSSQELQTDISQARQDAGLPANGYFPGGPRGRGSGGSGFGGDLRVAASAIGISVEQLRSELAGNSLAQVAENHGKNPTDVATALKNDVNQQIDNRISQLVNRTIPQNADLSQGQGLLLDPAAQAIGISTDQLRSELPGKSPATVAQAHGKTAADLTMALENAAHQQIDGRIDQGINQTFPQRRAPQGTGQST